MDTPRTLTDAVKYFAHPENCLSYLVARRWSNGVTCPTCGSKGVYFDKTRQGWICKSKHPKRKFSLKTGTIFEDSPLGLDKWLPAVWMIANMKNGVSSWELHRSLGVTQKTAWFMLHRIRLAIQATEGGGGKLSGEVEADETFIGGKARFMHKDKRERLHVKRGRSLSGKVAVMGLLERHGPDGHSTVRTHVVKSVGKQLLQAAIRAQVANDTAVFTDALKSYDGLSTNFVHQVIDHAECYARGNVHTNGLENFWSLLKRALKGTYISVEPFHLFRYLDEQAFRFNHRRDMNDADRFSVAIYGILGKRLLYQDLIGAGNAPNGN
jgi:transposase-like protein